MSIKHRNIHFFAVKVDLKKLFGNNIENLLGISFDIAVTFTVTFTYGNIYLDGIGTLDI